MNLSDRILNKIYRMTNKSINLKRMDVIGIKFFAPNYLYFDNFNESSVIIDVGCGYEAELSRHLIEKHNLSAFGVDPTIKHAQSLQELEKSSGGKFHHLAIAVTMKNGFVTFYESKQNESGSILEEHNNMQNDEIKTYNVESLSLQGLVQRIRQTPIDFIKLDIEGAEYELLAEIKDEEINLFKQIFIEFHFRCTNHSVHETKLLVHKICDKGFKMFTLDQENYLFYK